ncbi:MAG: DUF45 domain-containing protein [Candidatus Moranbacteria bacterium]|nr:DUF45 domain-containing protein [Candidatus Moranbacteria bacterium]
MNQRFIQLNKQNFGYYLKKSFKAKNIRLTVNHKGELSATLPFFMSVGALETFMVSKKGWIIDKIQQAKQQKVGLLRQGNRKDYLKYKHRAYNFVLDRLQYYNRFYKFRFNRISIRNQRTRWGSCSGKRNLNFNYRIVFLPNKCADYLIVHELCHLKQMNHSLKFWQLVAKTIPDYPMIRKKFRSF